MGVSAALWIFIWSIEGSREGIRLQGFRGSRDFGGCKFKTAEARISEMGA